MWRRGGRIRRNAGKWLDIYKNDGVPTHTTFYSRWHSDIKRTSVDTFGASQPSLLLVTDANTLAHKKRCCLLANDACTAVRMAESRQVRVSIWGEEAVVVNSEVAVTRDPTSQTERCRCVDWRQRWDEYTHARTLISTLKKILVELFSYYSST